MLELTKLVRDLRFFATAIFTKETYRTKDSYFTRTTAKLTFEKLFSFIVGNNRNSAQVALNDFFRNTEDDPVAKQTLFEAREKISYKAFEDFNTKFVGDFYAEPDIKTYKGYFLQGVDGSIFQLPQGALNTFGGQKSALCETVSAQGRAMTVNDVLNRITIAAALKPIAFGERKMAQDLIENIRISHRSIYIFDRGFYSQKLCEYLNEKETKFLIRVKTNKCQKDIDRADKSDQIIVLDCGLKLRVINLVLPTGETEKLVTNVFDETFTVDDFAVIYDKRWGIEVSYLMLKERLAIENFTSAKEQLILQDFHAAIITYNMMEIACMEQEAKRLKDGVDTDSKHLKSANRNIVAHEVRVILLSLLLAYNPLDIAMKTAKIQRIIYRFFKDVRPNRSCPRVTKFPNKKFPMNKKGCVIQTV
jgi:hypothetical protein